MTREEQRTIIRSQLNDEGITYFADPDINNSIQDAYNDIVAKTQCIVKSVTLKWLSNINYYDFLNGNPNAAGVPQNLPVPDYLGTIAIFNNNSNLWLRDDLNLRDFNKLRVDWELWTGTPQYWSPKSLKYIVVVPRLAAGTGTFILWYWASAPQFTSPQNNNTDDVQNFLVATDMQILFQYYCMADLLESAEEPTKASIWWTKYLTKREEYKQRCRDNARADLLQRI